MPGICQGARKETKSLAETSVLHFHREELFPFDKMGVVRKIYEPAEWENVNAVEGMKKKKMAMSELKNLNLWQ